MLIYSPSEADKAFRKNHRWTASYYSTDEKKAYEFGFMDGVRWLDKYIRDNWEEVKHIQEVYNK